MFFSVKSFNFALLFSFMLFNTLYTQSVRTEQVIRFENPSDHSSYILLKAPDNLVGQHSIELPATGIAATLPAGIIVPYAGSTAPDGWLLCDGSAYDVSNYSNLYSVIGSTYGGSGSTFNVPNLGGKVPVGANSYYTLASIGGEETHNLTIEEMPSHNHILRGRTTNGVSNDPTNKTLGRITNLYVEYEPNVDMKNTSISFSGSGQAHNNMQPYITLNYIIKY